MSTHIALLRAVNVGGTGKLPMETLRGMCREAGFANPRTYVASGNLVLESERGAAEVKAELEARLAAHAGKPVGVIMRTPAEMEAVLAGNPFSAEAGNRVVAIFLTSPPPADALDQARHLADEQMRLGDREIYVFYPAGQGRSKLVIPAAAEGTARNMNTVASIVETAAAR